MVMKIAEAKRIANQFKNELGFVNSAAIEESLKRDEVIPINGVGFAHFHHRKDGQTTIYRVLCSAIERKQLKIALKCHRRKLMSKLNLRRPEEICKALIELGDYIEPDDINNDNRKTLVGAIEWFLNADSNDLDGYAIYGKSGSKYICEPDGKIYFEKSSNYSLVKKAEELGFEIM
jgi:hypothetical protein